MQLGSKVIRTARSPLKVSLPKSPALEALPADEPPHELESLLGRRLWDLVPPTFDGDEGEVVGRVTLPPRKEGHGNRSLAALVACWPPGSIEGWFEVAVSHNGVAGHLCVVLIAPRVPRCRLSEAHPTRPRLTVSVRNTRVPVAIVDDDAQPLDEGGVGIAREVLARRGVLDLVAARRPLEWLLLDVRSLDDGRLRAATREAWVHLGRWRRWRRWWKWAGLIGGGGGGGGGGGRWRRSPD